MLPKRPGMRNCLLVFYFLCKNSSGWVRWSSFRVTHTPLTILSPMAAVTLTEHLIISLVRLQRFSNVHNKTQGSSFFALIVNVSDCDAKRSQHTAGSDFGSGTWKPNLVIRPMPLCLSQFTRALCCWSLCQMPVNGRIRAEIATAQAWSGYTHK